MQWQAFMVSNDGGGTVIITEEQASLPAASQTRESVGFGRQGRLLFFVYDLPRDKSVKKPIFLPI